MNSSIRSVAAFAVCFAVGASLCLLLGLESRTWVPAGLVVSTVVAVIALKK